MSRSLFELQGIHQRNERIILLTTPDVLTHSLADADRTALDLRKVIRLWDIVMDYHKGQIPAAKAEELFAKVAAKKQETFPRESDDSEDKLPVLISPLSVVPIPEHLHFSQKRWNPDTG